MRLGRALARGFAMAVASGACSGSSPAAPNPTVSLAGSWSGPGSNSLGRHSLTLTISQDGSSLTGTAATSASDPTDGSCSSCHMNKVGTFTGRVSGSAISLEIVFPSGNAAEPTPICSATMSLAAGGATESRVAGTYAGADTCEGAWTDGVVSLTRTRGSQR